MSIVSAKLEEIEDLISSQSNASKSVAYSTLLRIQEESTSDCRTVQELAESSKRLISLIAADSLNEDEEIASKALKCLGFTIYHTNIAMTVPVDVAGMVLETLSQVITTTKMKSVCNLGVWCISMQQIEESLLTAHFESLLKAAVHALDNPFGSLSTTFEAIQAVLKLASQLSDLMRNSSHIWAPPLYRRLLSNDKRERDMTGRCLSKIKSLLLPPPLLLSKGIASDMKPRLLTRMKEMLNEGLKIQALQAWGWFIRLLGCHALENRSLVNDMLKVPEMTFTDIDTQVQISTQVAWEALIDTLIQSPTSIISKEKENQHLKGLLKSIKLIMMPLTGIVSSKCDLSVHSSCLNTWCYLLHKLDICINHQSVKKLALEPIFNAVFCHRLESSRICMWKLCFEVLDRSVSAKLKQNFDRQGKNRSLPYPMKWMPWDLDQLDFYLHWAHKTVSEAPLAAAASTDEDKSSLHNAGVRVFKSILIGTQMEFSSPSITYDDIFCSLKKILDFVKSISNEPSGSSLLLIRIIFEELESSIVGSPLYKVPLNLKFIEDLQSFKGFEHVVEISSITYMGLVSPMVYLLVICFYDFAQKTPETPNMEEIHRIMKLAAASYNPLENFAVITNLLHRFITFNSLKIWIAAAEPLNDCIDIFMNDLGCSVICHFLSYPFSACGSSEESRILLQRNHDLENVTSAWLSIYHKISNVHLQNCTAMGLHDQLCRSLNQYIGYISGLLDCSGYGDLVLDLFCLYGNVLMFVLEHNLAEQVTCDDVSMFFCNTLRIAAKFIVLPKVKNRTDTSSLLASNPRVFSSIGSWFKCLHSKHNILSSIEIMSPALLQWLSDTETNDPSITDQFHLLWNEVVTSLSRSQPPITYDSSFLATQATLLEKALGHPNPSISDRTIDFWNTTYGNQPYSISDYPPRLLCVLDRLSRNRRINLLNTANRYTVTAKHGGISKRVGLLEAKRKRCELTEHQKEVKRAQQGKGRDSGGHGPGVRTYTNLDFSQGNEDSQEESQGL